MLKENNIVYNSFDDTDEDLNINVLKFLNVLWSRKSLIIKVFLLVLIFFTALTFVLPKKYKVTADLYVNKSNNSNMVEFNPYMFEDSSTMISMGTDKAINNEIELMKSALVLDKVIRDNDIKYKKGKRKGELLSAKAFYGKGKTLKLENLRNTSVISIEFKAKNPDFAYSVVNSLIDNYILLHKEINSAKSKADKSLIEMGYKEAKENLNKTINQSSGLPAQSMSNLGNLSALSAYSTSARKALGSVRGQYVAGERSHIAVSEETQKVANLASKLEWAKMVEQMSDASKVLVINPPQQLNRSENFSPKLFMNIVLGIIFGFLASLIAVYYSEIADKRLTYSKLSDNIIFNGLEKIDFIRAEVFGYSPKRVLLISFEQLPSNFVDNLCTLPNVDIVAAGLSTTFSEKISNADFVMLVSKVFATGAENYKIITEILKKQNKNVIYDILI